MGKLLEYLKEKLLKEIQRFVKRHFRKPEKEEKSMYDEMDFSLLPFDLGGFNGKHAVEDETALINNLRISPSRMSYSWNPGCSLDAWGLDRGEAGALACLFYKNGAKWHGGKIDWISTSRTFRSFDNITGHYNGWEPEPFFNATEFAFCIVSRGGDKRSNVITFAKQ